MAFTLYHIYGRLYGMYGRMEYRAFRWVIYGITTSPAWDNVSSVWLCIENYFSYMG